MKKILVSTLTIITIIAAFVILKIGSAVIDIDLKSPIGSPVGTDYSADSAASPIVLTETVPIALDCRAVTTVTADIAVTKKYKLLGKVVSTDTVNVHAVGDYDACVDGLVSRTTTTVAGARSQKIVVPADAVVFHRPRLDNSRTTVEYDRGRISRMASPISDDNSIVDISLKVAQQVVGSSDCIESAWDSTRVAVEESLRQQAAADGISNVTIEWHGKPKLSSAIEPLSNVADVTSNVNDLKCVSK